MESEIDRMYRRTLPEQRWRFAGWTLLAYAGNALHAAVRPRILALLPGEFLPKLYLTAATVFIIALTMVPLGVLVAAYYYALRERRIHTAMTEFGLAARSSIAGLLALAGFVLALFINDGLFLPRSS